MIEQKFQELGKLAEIKNNSLFPKMADLVLVFFPSPGLFVRGNIVIPNEFKSEASIYYDADGEPFGDMYVFLPAVLQAQYDLGERTSGIVYEKDTLNFEPSLVEALLEQSPKVIEHRSS